MNCSIPTNAPELPDFPHQLSNAINNSFRSAALKLSNDAFYKDELHKAQAGIVFKFANDSFRAMVINIVRSLMRLCSADSALTSAQDAFDWFDLYSPVNRFIDLCIDLFDDLGFQDAIKPFLRNICLCVGHAATLYNVDTRELVEALAEPKKILREICENPWDQWVEQEE